jgi:hypothetical protein
LTVSRDLLAEAGKMSDEKRRRFDAGELVIRNAGLVTAPPAAAAGGR